MMTAALAPILVPVLAVIASLATLAAIVLWQKTRAQGATLAAVQAANQALTIDKQTVMAKCDAANAALAEATAREAAMREHHEAARRAQMDAQHKENRAQMEALDKRLEHHFSRIAQSVLLKQGERMGGMQDAHLQKTLGPLQHQLSEFNKRLNAVHSEQAKQQAKLEERIVHLNQLSLGLQTQAADLAQVLRKDSKTQGNWGEWVLEQLLQSAGLKPDVHYATQKNIGRDARYIPDVLLYLPGGRYVIIDAKVSMTAYTASMEATDDAKRKEYVAAHLRSLRAHIAGLADKHYADEQDNAFHYVLMFVSPETGLLHALEADKNLYLEALNKRVLLVTPTTLFASLSAINTLWQEEAQRENVAKISEQGTKIYDKVRLFLDDMESIGTRLDQAQKSYDAACNKLSVGQGNLLRLTEKMREMGVKVKKPMNTALLK